MQFFLYILLAIVILLVMVTIHEFGHYCAAKLFKFKVTEFSIGFGPKLFQKVSKKTGEKFTLRAIPLGGYCAFKGDDEASDPAQASAPAATGERTFYEEKPYKRIVVLLSGALFNFLSAIVFSFIYLVSVGYAVPVVASVTYDPSTGIAYNTLFKDDVITAVDGQEINVMNTFDEVLAKVQKNLSAGDSVIFTIERNGVERQIPLTWQTISPSYAGFGFEYSESADGARVQSVLIDPSKQTPYPGILKDDLITAVNGQSVTAENTLSQLTKDIPLGETVRFTVLRSYVTLEIDVEKITVVAPAYEGFGFSRGTEIRPLGFGGSLLYSVPFTGKMAWAILGSFGNLFTGQTAVTDMAGPVGTITQIAQLGQTDWRYLLNLLPLLAANLAIFNLLPFPALDGAKVIFTAIEWIRRKPVNRKVENMIHFIGLAVLLLFVIVIDLVGFVFRGGAGSGFLRL